MAAKKSKRYRQVLNEDGDKGPFKVLLIHGHSKDWIRIKDFIKKELSFRTKVLVEQFTGEALLTKVRRSLWEECDCAVAILSGDDLLETKKRRARPNVLFEVGYCMGFFDYRYWENNHVEPVILIVEKDTEIPSDLHGVEFIEYGSGRRGGIKRAYPKLREGLENLFSEISDYFD
jgi:predicted nucleotide-binding protein